MAASGETGVVFRRSDDQSEDSDIWDDTALIKAYDKAVNKLKAKMCNGDVDEKSPNPQTNKKRRNNRRKVKKNDKKTQGQWKIGDKCQCIYSEDQLYYEARILSIDNNDQTCNVRFSGYGNEEEKNLSELLQPEDTHSQHEQSFTVSESESMDWAGGFHSPANHKKGKGAKTGKKSAHGANIPFQYPMMPPPSFPMSSPMYPAAFPPAWSSHYNGGHMRSAMVPPPPPPFSDDISDLDNEALCSMLMSWYMSGYHTGYYQGLRDGKMNSRHSAR